MAKNFPSHVDGLIQFMSAPDEKANEDLALAYFRKTFGNQFTRQKEADRSDGYLPGHFVLELKGKTDDWLAGFFQGLAYRRNLNFSVVVVVAKSFFAVWSIDSLDEKLVEEVLREKGAPSHIGRSLAKRYRTKKAEILRACIYKLPAEYMGDLFRAKPDVLIKEFGVAERAIFSSQKVKSKITPRNFTKILSQMVDFFESDTPIKAVRAFYSMVFGWNESAVLEISTKRPDQATLGGEVIENLRPGSRERFKLFVESHFVSLQTGENVDDFFAKYDQALDSVDPAFRIKHGIFFTDLDLSKFVMWSVRKHVGDIGKNYLVIDPACGSGNLVTNWKSPLELRHKVVSEIEPELLYTVEQRMKGDKWHNGKFTVVPKVSEGKGLNFLDISAETYVETIQHYLTEKGHRANKPIAFLCNPPYRSDDDQAADSIKYDIHPSILELTGKDGGAERYCCFLAQMKLICEKAADSGMPGESLLLLFTKAAWLTRRPVFSEIRNTIFSNFEDVGGMIVNSREFFDVKGRFPIAFTIWRYRGPKAKLNPNRSIELTDLTWLKKDDLAAIDWSDANNVDRTCAQIMSNKSSVSISMGAETENIKEWSGLKRYDFQREKRKDEKNDPSFQCGLPAGDKRHARKKTLGEKDGAYIGFVDDLTPCRIRRRSELGPWFRLNNQFMDCRKTRCLSGPPDNRGFEATNPAEAKKAFTWYALARVFATLGYPMWVDAEEMWPLEVPKHLEQKLTDLVYAISYAENECLELSFPAGNPVRSAKEASVANPLSPLAKDSFWNQHLRPEISKEIDSNAGKLVAKTDAIYALWRKELGSRKEIYVEYERPYFVGDGCLKLGAGLVQIRDYAKETANLKLISAFDDLNVLLKLTKLEFNSLLFAKNGFNYFSLQPKTRRVANVATVLKSAVPFDKVLELRLALSSKIVFELGKSPDFNRVKFAKTFFLADAVTAVDLKTEYFREASGPLDQRALYNSKVGIEPLAARSQLFTAEMKKGKVFDFVQYKAGERLESEAKKFDILFGADSAKVETLLRLIKPMNRDQVEIVATLFACWNDLLVAKKKPSDSQIVKEFRSNWHPLKSKKFESIGPQKKPTFTEAQLYKALDWMRANSLVPSGTQRLTKQKVEAIPF